MLDKYDKLPSGINPQTQDEEQIIVNKIIDLLLIWKIRAATCAEEINCRILIEVNRCIDPILLRKLGVDNIDPTNAKDKSQRRTCWCIPSVDIGTYHTCKHECIYCYAR
jgi:hypothetical protein